MNAVSGVENINENKIGLLSILIGCPREEIRKFLLAHGRRMEEEGGSLTDQLPLSEKTHSVTEQQQNTCLKPQAQPESDKPFIKKEGIEEMKEASLEEERVYPMEQDPVINK